MHSLSNATVDLPTDHKTIQKKKEVIYLVPERDLIKQ